MKFELVDRQGYIPDLNYGEANQELSCFIPHNYSFTQANYSNGEGIAVVSNHSWHFFFTQEGIGVQLVDGIVTLREAERFLMDIKQHIWGVNHQVQIFIAGVTPK
ncbi:hypothetical protein OFY17_00920 [Marinomonas sp. C2222]|uniref:Uncharacterized protein n=1 Tax=Marinomonas sargassi TaxID=2984494 RepID=A0ABT2YNG6_9GAMM|nr:hypothetical protein [Marinomonas sargassi]MCV2401432.1 hypothetical protein [Marinomonas sargassi]